MVKKLPCRIPSFPFRFEERQEIERLLALGYSYHKIAVSMKRSYNGIRTEVKRNKYPYKAAEAQEASELLKTTKYELLSEINKKKPHKARYPAIEEKIEILEFQLEIITTQLRELINAKNN